MSPAVSVGDEDALATVPRVGRVKGSAARRNRKLVTFQLSPTLNST